VSGGKKITASIAAFIVAAPIAPPICRAATGRGSCVLGFLLLDLVADGGRQDLAIACVSGTLFASRRAVRAGGGVAIDPSPTMVALQLAERCDRCNRRACTVDRQVVMGIAVAHGPRLVGRPPAN
jgi:hypothetical protein